MAPAAPAAAPLADLGGIVPEHRAKDALWSWGVPFPEGRPATTLAEAEAVADGLGYPVVLKAQSAELSHKSDAGGVVVGLAAHRPGLALDGVLVERMGARGLELIVGARNDPAWGAVVLVGFGGVQAEVLKDVRLIPPDLDEDAIVAETASLRGAALLQGFRGAPSLDVRAAARIVVAVGRVMATRERARADGQAAGVIAPPPGSGRA